MTTRVLDRPLTELPTELFPELEPVARLAGAAGGVEDRSIVVIENPVVRNQRASCLPKRSG